MRDGSYYEGQFVNGEIEGTGKRFWASSGNNFEGHFSRGEINGKGVMKYGDGSEYEGSWEDNKREGMKCLVRVNSKGSPAGIQLPKVWTYFTPCSSVSVVNFEHVNFEYC